MRCVACGGPAREAHHILGRAVGPQVVPLCSWCHHHIHNRLRGLDLDGPGGMAGTPPAGLAELGLRRLVVLGEFLEEHGAVLPGPVLMGALAHLAALLVEVPA
jgi:hypothetical protein